MFYPALRGYERGSRGFRGPVACANCRTRAADTTCCVCVVPDPRLSPADASQLEVITQKLIVAEPEAKLLFALTSPYMCSASNDGCVINLNNQAAKIMAKYSIPTINLHDAVVAECGPPPASRDTHFKCFNQSGCFCPHCPQDNGVGYEFLAAHVIVPAITKLLPTLP